MCPAIPKVLLDLTTSTEIGDPSFGDLLHIANHKSEKGIEIMLKSRRFFNNVAKEKKNEVLNLNPTKACQGSNAPINILKERRNSFKKWPLNLWWFTNKTIIEVGNIAKNATLEVFFT